MPKPDGRPAVEVMNGVSRPMLSSAFAWKVNSMYDQMTDTTVD